MDFFMIGVLTFDEFLVAFIQMQRGRKNSSNHCQYLKNNIPPGILPRLSLLIFAMSCLPQQINHFDQCSKSLRIQQHPTRLIVQRGYIKQDNFLRFFLYLVNIFSFFFVSPLYFSYKQQLFNQTHCYFHHHHFLEVVEIDLQQYQLHQYHE